MSADNGISDHEWAYKQAACLEALNIADGLLSNYKYENVKEGDLEPSKKPTVEDVRHCINKLIVSCEESEVIDWLHKILRLDGPVTPDIAVDIRAAVRKELGFKKEVLTSDRIKAFIGRIW